MRLGKILLANREWFAKQVRGKVMATFGRALCSYRKDGNMAFVLSTDGRDEDVVDAFAATETTFNLQ
jgi:hypothetical protein